MLDTIPILVVWLVSVSYRYTVVGILVGIFGTVSFWWELSFDDLAGTHFLNNLAGTAFFLKRGARFIKKGANAPLLREKRVLKKFQYRNVPTKFSFGMGIVNTRKIPTDTNQNTELVSNSTN